MKSKVSKKKGWKELPQADLIIGGGTAREFKTGDWRAKRPLLLSEKCINCLACWIYCPDSAVIIKEGKVVGFDYDHCKGCGICAHECPVKGKAIIMVSEKEAKKKPETSPSTSLGTGPEQSRRARNQSLDSARDWP